MKTTKNKPLPKCMSKKRFEFFLYIERLVPFKKLASMVSHEKGKVKRP